MAIFVPPGDRRDPTRLPQFYGGTFEYLKALGLSLARGLYLFDDYT